MSYYNQNQPPVGVPPPQGYPPEGYPKDAYPPPGYPPQGYPSPYGQPPPQRQQSSKAGKKTRKMACLIKESNTNATYGHSAIVMKKGGPRRKPLSDVSNGNQTSRKEKNKKLTSKKKQKKKLSAVTEELFHEEESADEIDVHNHEECIKAKHQEMAMEINNFLKFVGAANDFSKELPSLNMPESPPRSPPRSPLSLLEEEMWEPISRYVSPDPSPLKLPDDDQYLKYWDDRNFSLDTLIDSPKLVKH